MKILEHYIAFKRIKNFACVEVHPQTGKILLYLKVNPDSIELETGLVEMYEIMTTMGQVI